jgi:ABC-type phosphate/phosphonate transport system permease subunit
MKTTLREAQDINGFTGILLRLRVKQKFIDALYKNDGTAKVLAYEFSIFYAITLIITIIAAIVAMPLGLLVSAIASIVLLTTIVVERAGELDRRINKAVYASLDVPVDL